MSECVCVGLCWRKEGRAGVGGGGGGCRAAGLSLYRTVNLHPPAAPLLPLLSTAQD